MCYNSQLTEEHFISCYISGLKEELIPFLDIAHPNSFTEAYEQAKLHERALAVINRKLKGNYRGPNAQFIAPNQPKGAQTYNGPRSYTTSQQTNNKTLLEQRRAAGQCFKCGERYYPGHICSNKSINVLQGLEETVEVYDENCLQEETTEEETENVEELCNPEMGVSVLALNGERPQNTIKISGESKEKNLTILVDTGSTHSFIDYQTARGIKANMVSATPLMVTVANGQKVLSKLQCPGVTPRGLYASGIVANFCFFFFVKASPAA